MIVLALGGLYFSRRQQQMGHGNL